ncbi:MAG: ribonuclease [Patescibacteria group bacterium]|jgi:ribonuclease HI|nr:ribonuclease [Patescibacteria group bacterium]
MVNQEIKIFCDGGSRGNPGPSAAGVVITTTEDEILTEHCEYLGIQTNNFAEYSAVLLALRNIDQKHLIGKITFYLDSQLVVRQLNGEYKVKNANIKGLYEQIVSQISNLNVSFHHVYREDNKLADAQVNKCLDDRL